MLRRALLVAALPAPLSVIAVPAPASAANGPTATFPAANNGSWFLDKEEAGTRGHANLIAMVPECTVFHDLQSTSTFCFTGNGGQWWSFDDTWPIRQKTSRLKSKGPLGAMVWEMSGDTASGTLMTTPHNGLSS